MNFDDYQISCKSTAVFPGKDKGDLIYPVLGLCGEAGEVAEKLKKLIRDKNNIRDKEFMDEIKKELGDVLWYVATICTSLNFGMEDVARTNIIKLLDRKKRNKLQGNGDYR